MQVGQLVALREVVAHGGLTVFLIFPSVSSYFSGINLQVLSTMLLRLLPGRNWYGLTGVALACLYQYLLSCARLRAFVLHGRYGNNSRRGFLDANREGLCSCAGYLALYFIGVQVGKFLFQER